jgi:uncharacterized protein YcbX
VIETEPGLEGLVEQAWIGKQLSVADVALDCVDTTLRCGAITRAQEGLPFDKSILRTVVRQADQNFGVYCTIPEAGIIGVGDAVMLA